MDTASRGNRCYGCHVVELYNHERPHQALNMKYPGELYTPSPRPYQGLGELEYPFHDRTITVTSCGRIGRAASNEWRLCLRFSPMCKSTAAVFPRLTDGVLDALSR